MKRLDKAFLALGLLGFVLLARRMDPAIAWAAFARVRWGLLLVIGQELGPYLMNTLGWRACLAPEHRTASLARTIRIRIIGDSLNYLVPSGAVAGTWTKSVLLGEDIPMGSRLSSAVMAKIAQTMAMALTTSCGLAILLAAGSLGDLAGRAVYGLYALGAFALLLVAGGAVLASGRLDARLSRWNLAGDTARSASELIRRRPGQLGVSILWFMAAYLWGAVEAFIICRLLGVPATPAFALKLEIMSIFLDAAFFYVPAKAGTQESTKTFIFLTLGRPASEGFMFGLIRHVRELTWAGVGLLLSRFTRPMKTEPPLRGAV